MTAKHRNPLLVNLTLMAAFAFAIYLLALGPLSVLDSRGWRPRNPSVASALYAAYEPITWLCQRFDICQRVVDAYLDLWH